MTRWEPFWALAEEMGIPIGFHLAVLVKKTRLDEAIAEPAIWWSAVASRFAKEPPGMQLLEPMTGLIFAACSIAIRVSRSSWPKPGSPGCRA